MGFALTAPDHRRPERRKPGRESEIRIPGAEGRPEAQGPVGETDGDPSGSSNESKTTVGLRTRRRIFGSSDWQAFGFVGILGLRVESGVFGPHRTCDLRVTHADDLGRQLPIGVRSPARLRTDESPERVETSVTAPSGPSRVWRVRLHPYFKVSLQRFAQIGQISVWRPSTHSAASSANHASSSSMIATSASSHSGTISVFINSIDHAEGP